MPQTPSKLTSRTVANAKRVSLSPNSRFEKHTVSMIVEFKSLFTTSDGRLKSYSTARMLSIVERRERRKKKRKSNVAQRGSANDDAAIAEQQLRHKRRQRTSRPAQRNNNDANHNPTLHIAQSKQDEVTDNGPPMRSASLIAGIASGAFGAMRSISRAHVASSITLTSVADGVDRFSNKRTQNIYILRC